LTRSKRYDILNTESEGTGKTPASAKSLEKLIRVLPPLTIYKKKLNKGLDKSQTLWYNKEKRKRC
jgi:hypothetical protein